MTDSIPGSPTATDYLALGELEAITLDDVLESAQATFAREPFRAVMLPE